VRTGASRSIGTPVNVNLPWIWDRAVVNCVALAARGEPRFQHAVWGQAGGVPAILMLEYTLASAPPVRWFTPLAVATAGIPPRYRWNLLGMLLGSRLAGLALPSPELVPLDDPSPIVNWLAETLRAGSRPHLHTTASCAVRVAQAALEAGIRLEGALLTMASEPTTPARLAAVCEAGAEARVFYVSVESGPIGYGCPAAEAPDEVHQARDFLAVIQVGSAADGVELSAKSLLCSTVRPTAPLMLLNVSLGDEAEVNWRSCGCELQEIGWTMHLKTIRSREKLTAGGMTFLDSDLIRVLEQVLPDRFGGGPTDYQLTEEETSGGLPSVTLLVDPAVGEPSPHAVAEVFLTEIGSRSATARFMELNWRAAGLPRVERRRPYTTGAGKILHLHRT
jgi:hypothetical protein